ncbi:MAG: glucans biosynthesis glucosyltransferase MdoH [Hyphomicrobiales bacterium]
MTPTARRITFGTLVFFTIAGLLALMAWALSPAEIVPFEWLLLMCFAITLPWTAIGFWNAVIGFGLMRFTKNPAASVFPDSQKIKDNDPITKSTAVAMCIRNEDVGQVNRNLTAMIARLVASGSANNFHVYILSDSSEDDVIAEEQVVFEKLRRDWAEKIGVTYRLRTDNKGFKAGNIRDFCDTWGVNHDFMLTLDADSVMSASSILRLVRVMQANDKLGILQSLVVGLPSDSAFTRVFQFGMRMGMKSYTLGSAWWQGDCGPYWGHNALIRLEPFMEHCHLPILPGKGPLSGYILSHDQVEAVYMRRAGYECRVLAEEGGSYEENPPHILEFIRRDLRWCHGNMQYLKLLSEPDLKPTSRVQLVLAILMFTSAPAWMTFVSVATWSIIFSDMTFSGFQMGPGYILFLIVMTMIFAPKLVSIADVLMRSKLRKAYGGGLAVITSAAVEILFSMLLAPIMAVAETIFLAGLPFGKARGWASQDRQVTSLPVGVVASHLWPQMLFGLLGVTALFVSGSVTLNGFLVSLPVFIGPFLAIPLGFTSAHVSFGNLFTRLGFWQLPEEQSPPVIIRAINLPALAIRGQALSDKESHQPLSTQQLLDIDMEMEERLAA